GALIALARLIGRRRGDEPNAAVGERLLQRRERHLGIMRPAIGRAIAERLVILADALPIGDRRIVLGREAETLIAFGHRFLPSFFDRSRTEPTAASQSPQAAGSLGKPSFLDCSISLNTEPTSAFPSVRS